jgi:hypothetical protein
MQRMSNRDIHSLAGTEFPREAMMGLLLMGLPSRWIKDTEQREGKNTLLPTEVPMRMMGVVELHPPARSCWVRQGGLHQV